MEPLQAITPGPVQAITSIRDILGHVDLSTTEIYARASTEAKRKALEAVYDQVVSADLPEWSQNPDLLTWLTSL